MFPAGKVLGFAARELAQKLPDVYGILLRTTIGSVVEVTLFVVLVIRGDSSIPIIKEAMGGSVIANLLFCIGSCFFVGGLRRPEQEINKAIADSGSSLLLVAGSKIFPKRSCVPTGFLKGRVWICI